LGDSVTVSIRDDGVGIAEGRLEEAVAEGRVGVAKSIVGRMNWLGGSAKLNTGPGCGTEWELTIPRRGWLSTTIRSGVMRWPATSPRMASQWWRPQTGWRRPGGAPPSSIPTWW